jgi:hypothetical protein
MLAVVEGREQMEGREQEEGQGAVKYFQIKIAVGKDRSVEEYQFEVGLVAVVDS